MSDTLTDAERNSKPDAQPDVNADSRFAPTRADSEPVAIGGCGGAVDSPGRQPGAANLALTHTSRIDTQRRPDVTAVDGQRGRQRWPFTAGAHLWAYRGGRSSGRRGSRCGLRRLLPSMS